MKDLTFIDRVMAYTRKGPSELGLALGWSRQRILGYRRSARTFNIKHLKHLRKSLHLTKEQVFKLLEPYL